MKVLLSSAIKAGCHKMFCQNPSLRKHPALCGSAVNMRSIHRREQENGENTQREFENWLYPTINNSFH
ncbi:MAG TPA: hypothetical protein VGE25_11785 [Sediminibacterium sp.]